MTMLKSCWIVLTYLDVHQRGIGEAVFEGRFRRKEGTFYGIVQTLSAVYVYVSVGLRQSMRRSEFYFLIIEYIEKLWRVVNVSNDSFRE